MGKHATSHKMITFLRRSRKCFHLFSCVDCVPKHQKPEFPRRTSKERGPGKLKAQLVQREVVTHDWHTSRSAAQQIKDSAGKSADWPVSKSWNRPRAYTGLYVLLLNLSIRTLPAQTLASSNKNCTKYCRMQNKLFSVFMSVTVAMRRPLICFQCWEQGPVMQEAVSLRELKEQACRCSVPFQFAPLPAALIDLNLSAPCPFHRKLLVQAPPWPGTLREHSICG